VAYHPGGFVAAWESDGQDGSGMGVFGKIASFGAGAEFSVNSYTIGDQRDPSVASDGSGAFVVVWTSPQDGSGEDVFAQRFTSGGAPLGPEFRVNTYTTGSQYQPAVAATSGDFVVVWSSVGQEGAGAEVFGQRFSSSGLPLGTEFRVNSYTTGDQYRPAVGSDGNSNFMVVWQDGAAPGGPGGPGRGVFGRSYDGGGTPAGPEFQVNTYTTGFHGAPAIAVDSAGSTAVVWHSDGQDGSGLGIFGQRYNVFGGPIASEFQVNSYTTGSQSYPSVGKEWNGLTCFVVAWSSEGQDESGSGIFGRVYYTGSEPLEEFRYNQFTTGSQTRASVGPIPFPDLVVLWDSEGQDGSGTAAYGVVDNHFIPVELMTFGVE
jgi:hypothetical protein